MEKVLWLLILVPVSALFTGIGIYAARRKEPMWFWSGTQVRKEEISDVRAYNRANGILWIAFSSIFWAAALLGAFLPGAGGILLAAGCTAGIPCLAAAYGRILRKYKRKR